MSKPSFTRHEIREKALQALFPLDFNVDLTKQDAISYALELDNQEIISEDGEEFVPTYLDLLVGGVCDRKAEIDEVVKKHLGNNWSITRIAKMDLIILRMAIFEMFYVGDVPNTVALDEAIELAKKYSDDRSRKFVNGVLANVMKDIDSK
ncbi:transcription antitermination factor NusB [Enterococcus caccae]|uniref:Transcription antitermination protein NusB n=1 Tax=Enterococcus caccae ATCC BAA-1240 TaxID=1158612 RepID=R3U1P3_9ENTE|nr:transcription antitermination factor NusB [Enterococcus caccae]EOL47829.1 transcription antitermination factor NusB [Enterococcus caccae ATCC BAA-1240]EOT65627.1 transcription antitermination factor NusB [Enterococcus caccae ATCC BAA-1240]